jgi:hypothetical protein
MHHGHAISPRILLAALASAALALPAAAEGGSARVTAVSGTATAGNAPLAQRDAVGEGQPIQTAADTNLAVLLDEDALAELCEDTRMTLARTQDGRRVLRVEAGEARIVVEPGRPGEILEIHTPVAVAQILGTVIHVEVDPVTGETTFTSADHDVVIRNLDPGVQGKTQITGGESTTIARGEAPGEKRRRQLDEVGDCLVDLHELSVRADSAANGEKVTEKIAEVDMGDADLPGVGAGGELLEPPEESSDETDVIEPVDTHEIESPEEEPEPEPPIPPDDIGINF